MKKSSLTLLRMIIIALIEMLVPQRIALRTTAGMGGLPALRVSMTAIVGAIP
jgi:hypothetical protein